MAGNPNRDELDRMAEATREAWLGDQRAIDHSWQEISEGSREDWRRAVRGLLAANAATLPSPFPGAMPPPEGGFKPGDRVSVPGVVAWVGTLIGVDLGPDEDVAVRPEDLTFIERPALLEPDWQPGDLAVDGDGVRYVYTPGNADLPAKRSWFKITGTIGWRLRDEIPGRLHKLTVTREEEA